MTPEWNRASISDEPSSIHRDIPGRHRAGRPENVSAVYTARNRDQWGFDLRRRSLGAQGDAIREVAVSLQPHRGTN